MGASSRQSRLAIKALEKPCHGRRSQVVLLAPEQGTVEFGWPGSGSIGIQGLSEFRPRKIEVPRLGALGVGNLEVQNVAQGPVGIEKVNPTQGSQLLRPQTQTDGRR